MTPRLLTLLRSIPDPFRGPEYLELGNRLSLFHDGTYGVHYADLLYYQYFCISEKFFITLIESKKLERIVMGIG